MPKFEVYLQNGETKVVEATRMEGKTGFVQFIDNVPGHGECLVAFFLDSMLIGANMIRDGGSDAKENGS